MAKSKTRKNTSRRTPKKKGRGKAPSLDLSEAIRIEAPNVTVKEQRKKPRLLAILFSDFINVANDGKPNLIGVFDSIAVDRTLKQTAHFFVYIRVAEIEDSFVTTVFNGDDQPVLQFTSVIEVKEFTRDLPHQSQAIIGLQISRVEKEGIFWFDVSHKGNSLGGAGLPITYIPEEGGKGSGTRTYI